MDAWKAVVASGVPANAVANVSSGFLGRAPFTLSFAVDGHPELPRGGWPLVPDCGTFANRRRTGRCGRSLGQACRIEPSAAARAGTVDLQGEEGEARPFVSTPLHAVAAYDPSGPEVEGLARLRGGVVIDGPSGRR